jgi:hypothetical protein
MCIVLNKQIDHKKNLKILEIQSLIPYFSKDLAPFNYQNKEKNWPTLVQTSNQQHFEQEIVHEIP